MLDWIPYEVMKLLGWTTVVLVLLSASFHLLLRLNKGVIKRKSSANQKVNLGPFFQKLIPFAKAYHKQFGAMAVLTGLLHGYLLLGSFQLHTGYLTWLFILVMATSGMSMLVVKSRQIKRKIRFFHTVILYLLIILVIVHVYLMKYAFL